MRIKKALSSTFLLVGACIGAGFSSGREIVLFFGNKKGSELIVSAFVALFVFCFSCLFLRIGAKYKPRSFLDFSKRLFGKYDFLCQLSYTLCSFFSLTAMLAGVDALFSSVFSLDFSFFSAIVYFVCSVFAISGISGVEKFDGFLTPLLVLAILFVTFGEAGKGERLAEFSPFSVMIPFFYTSLNFSSTSFLLVEEGRDMTKGEACLSSVLSAVIIGGLCYRLLSSLLGSGFENADLPLVEMARQRGDIVYKTSLIALLLGITTTLITSFHYLYTRVKTKISGKGLSVLAVFLPCFITSRLGFSEVVSYLYPVESLFGGVLFLFAVRAYFSDNAR